MSQPESVTILDPNEPSERLAQAARVVAILRESGDQWEEVLIVVLRVVVQRPDLFRPKHDLFTRKAPR